MEDYNIYRILSLLELACTNQIDFGVADDDGCFLSYFESSFLLKLRGFEDPLRSFINYPAVPSNIQTIGASMEWVSLFLRRYSTKLIVMVRVCFSFRALWN